MICGAMQPLPTAGSPTISETSFREQWLHWDTKTRARSSCSRITKRKISSDTHELKKKLIAPRNSGFLLTKKKNLQGLSETPQSPTRYPKSSADAEAWLVEPCVAWRMLPSPEDETGKPTSRDETLALNTLSILSIHSERHGITTHRVVYKRRHILQSPTTVTYQATSSFQSIVWYM